MEENDAGLNESELGTKEYWVEHYKTEVENFKEYGDVGEIWFGNSTLRDVIKWFQSNSKVNHDEPIIDLGCGNGMTLINLAKLGYTNLTGVDYSQEAIDLASSIMDGHQLSGIKYQVADLITDNDVTSLGVFKAVFDKGTYDAISLSPNDALTKRDAYRNNVCKLLMESGLFVITSCNWTENELKHFFSSEFSNHFPENQCLYSMQLRSTL
ncbi:EEF1A lysine methyltransferase 2 isoform X2 [Nilaparvata lugens]|uniref:EEF1A lysine methyltransferase 2 isoform X2 n=1 Tax=Nilaparvata lugens TaxID=108931 RepID=UPI00193C9AF1|nr:EEF1A lysine methyltransferase 2 isoform X2 [Nilaparvata lugens]